MARLFKEDSCEDVLKKRNLIWSPIVADSMALYENPQLPLWNVRHGLLELEHGGIFGYLGQTYISFVTCWKWQDCQDARVCYSKADHDSEQGSLALNIAVLGVTLRTCSIACLRPS